MNLPSFSAMMDTEVIKMDASINLAHYGEERERIATESELEVFEQIKKIVDRDDVELVRRSDNYVSAVIGMWDLARIKFTPRAKWVAFPTAEAGPPKHRITAPEDVAEFENLLKESIKIITKYSG